MVSATLRNPDEAALPLHLLLVGARVLMPCGYLQVFQPFGFELCQLHLHQS